MQAVLRRWEGAVANFTLQEDGIAFLDKYFLLFTGAAVGYIPVIFFLKWVMKDRKPFNLRGLLVLWNLLLVVFNVLVLWYLTPVVLGWARSGSLMERMCYIPDDVSHGAPGVALFAFALSKVPEMIDTLFIVLHKKPLIVLHWYHHLTVMLYCWSIAYAPAVGTGGEGAVFAVMNAFVHTVMYTSYGLKAMRFRPPGDVFITLIQLAQMIFGAYIAIYRVTNCRVMRPWNAAGGVAMYLSYFYLFADFFYNKYLRPKKAGKSTTNGHAAAEMGKKKAQ